jgi:hypothetical protein
MVGVTTAAALVVTGCDHRSVTEPEAGVGTIEIHVPPPSMDIVDISRIELTITGPGISTPIVRDLSGDPATGWSAVLDNVPAGLGRTFVGRAYDGGAVIYEGIAAPVTILPGETSLVSLFMQETDPPGGFFNAAPRITGLTVDAYVVAPGGSVSLSVTAVDPDGDPLTWAWSSAAGSFSDPAAAATQWTAPEAQGSAMLRVGVSDPSGARATLEIMMSIGTGAGGASVTADVNSAPEILSLLPNPARAELDASVYLDLTARDTDGDALTFDWDVLYPCDGTFDDPTMEDPSFEAMELPEDGADCTLRVTVADARGGTNHGDLSLATGPGVCGSGPCGPVTPSPGELLWYSSLPWEGSQSLGGLGVGRDGTSYLVGYERLAGTTYDVVIHSFDADGGSIARATVETATSDEPRGAAVDAAGNLYVIGSRRPDAMLMKWAGGTALDWTTVIPGVTMLDLTIDRSDNVVVVGSQGNDLWVARFGPGGGPAEWSDVVPLPVQPSSGGVTTDLAGNVIVCSTRWLDYRAYAYFVKYAASGERLWSRQPDLGGSHRCTDVATSGSGDIYATGSVWSVDDDDTWLGRFDPMGNAIGSVEVDLGGASDIGRSVVVSSSGAVFVAGERRNDLEEFEGVWVGAYTASLSPRWDVVPLARGTSIALHPDGDLGFGGWVSGGTPDQDLLVGKYRH